MSEQLASLFAMPLDKEVRRHFERCWKAMWRDLDYLASREDSHLAGATANGWTLDRLRVVAVLNSFNRVVVGPLSAAYGTTTKMGLGRETAIHFGEHIEVSTRTAAIVQPAMAAFDELVARCGVKRRWLNISRTADLVWAMASHDDTSGGNDGETWDD